tara:strand:+ start:2675 stop:3760 length:1086 start_codon:yes stop_codon:yes gene_type:complete
MKQKRYMPWTALISIVLLNGCANGSDMRVALDAQSHLNVPALVPLKIPKGLQQLRKGTEYSFPPLVATEVERPVGEQVDIRPVQQVIASAPMTRLDESSKDFTVIVDPNREGDDVKAELTEVVQNYFKDLKVALDTTSSGYVFQTDWMRYQGMKGDLLPEDDDDFTFKQKYDVRLSPMASSSYQISIATTDYQERIQKHQLSLKKERNHQTVATLNGIIERLGEKRRNKDKNTNEIYAQDYLSVSLTENEQKEYVWQVCTRLDYAWEKLPSVLSELGFQVEDWDRSAGIYYVKMNETDHFWDPKKSSLVEQMRNQWILFKLVGEGDCTSIQVLDGQKRVLDDTLVLSLSSDFMKSIRRHYE